MMVAQGASGERSRITNDHLFEALSDRTRRIVLFHLRQRGVATFGDLVDVVDEYTDPREEVGTDDPERVAASLAEHHLPLLERLGLVVYDRLHDTVELGTVPEDFGEWLDLATKRELRWGATPPGADAGSPEADRAPETLSVLVVDDEPNLADVIGQFLERSHDMSVRTATNAPDAFAILEDAEVDCIVSDYQMPAIDGLDLLETVRDEYADIPFVLFTNKGSEEVASEAIAYDVSAYVPKGTGEEQYDRLAQQIRHAVDGYGRPE